MSIKITGISELNKNISAFKSEVISILVRGATDGAILIQNDAKLNHGLNAHDMGRYRNRTTNLTNSIQATPAKIHQNSIKSEVAALVDYAAAVEQGGKIKIRKRSYRSKPYPFMFPAFEKFRSKALGFFQGLVKNIRWVS